MLVNGLYLIEMYREEILYDKPLYVGTCILDLSKLHMMKFHYDVTQKEFNALSKKYLKLPVLFRLKTGFFLINLPPY